MAGKAPVEGSADTAGQTTSSSSSSQKMSPDLPMTRERALELLGVKDVPGGEENYGLMIGGLQRLISTYNEDWVRENRVRLVEELEQIAEM